MFTRSAITPPEVNGFGWNLGNSEYIVCCWPWHILGAIRAEARAGDLGGFVFLSGKQRTTLLISGQRNFMKFAHKTWFCDVVNPFGIFFFENLPLRGLFFQKNLQFCLIRVNDFRLQVAISPKRLQILENHDRLSRLWNVDFPFTPFEWTQSDSPGL